MISYTKKEISRLQDNLQLIRLAGGWSLSEFGDLLGVSKQTVSNLETKGKSRMSKLQYIGIRVILEYEVHNSPDNELLAYVVNLVFSDKDPTKEELDRVRSAVALKKGAESTGMDYAAIASSIGMIAGFVMTDIMADLLIDESVYNSTFKWLEKLMQPKNK